MTQPLTTTDYIELAGRTEKRFEGGEALTQFDMEIMHAALGVGGEAGEIAEEIYAASMAGRELDTVNLGEEAGDVTWFLAALTRHLELDSPAVDKAFQAGAAREFSVQDAANRISIGGGKIIDTVKRNLIYGKPLDADALADSVIECWTAAGSFCAAIGQPPERVMEANIAKLSARFGDKYTDQRANFRDLSAERETLDSGLSTANEGAPQ